MNSLMPSLKIIAALYLSFLFSPLYAGQPLKRAPDKAVCCEGTTYFSCICPGDKVCKTANEEYVFPAGDCDKPIQVTAQNIGNMIGTLQMSDPPCKNPDACRRIDVVEDITVPKNDPACRCREKTAVCRPRE
jgi:hypothetical protein